MPKILRNISLSEISFVDKGASGDDEHAARVAIWKRDKPMSFLDSLVTAIYSVVSKADGTPIVDHQGHTIPIDELESGAHVAQHITLSSEQWAAIGKALGVDIPPMPECGIAKIFVEDDGLWSEIKSGRLAEMSIAGTADIGDK